MTSDIFDIPDAYICSFTDPVNPPLLTRLDTPEINPILFMIDEKCPENNKVYSESRTSIYLGQYTRSLGILGKLILSPFLLLI